MRKRLVILGAGESGVGTAVLAIQKGYTVFVSDRSAILQVYKKKLEKLAVDFEENTHTEAKILAADIVMKSPGIPDKTPLIQKLIALHIPVISEIEFAAQFTGATIVAITGSNGKTTTTMLMHHVLKQANFDVGIGGNIGLSFAEQVATKSHKNYVLEISSFQLDGIEHFAPHIAVITNVTPDHLDRYHYNFKEYVASKFRITMNQTANDYLIYDADDLAIQQWLKHHKTKAKLVPFSMKNILDEGAFLKDNSIQTTIHNEQFNMSVSTLSLKGKHNTKNAMATTLAAQLLNVRKEFIKESLLDFEGVEHRLENLGKRDGIYYVNDSKATNVNAAFYALECMDKTTIWIVGGVDKGNDYTDLLPLVREKVKAIVCLGIDNHKIIETFENVVDIIVQTAGAEEAVKVSKKLAQSNDVVLLSPACASFDLFENYEDRGRQFKKAVFSV